MIHSSNRGIFSWKSNY